MRAVVVLVAALAMAVPVTAQETQGNQTAELLARLVRIDTSNPPGDTRPVAAELARTFDAAGIPNETILAPNGRAAHFIARLKGNGRKRPLLLAAHTDVVPADRTRWSVDPFAALVRDGYMYGRGTLDNKGAVAAFARAVLRLKERRGTLDRDIIFLAEADEEQGSFNTNWLAANHWDKIDAEFVLNEGGSISRQGGKASVMTVSYADKLTVNLKLRAEGQAGHSSRPLPPGASANEQLIVALGKLSAYREPVVLTRNSRLYLEKLAKLYPQQLAVPTNRLLGATDESGRAEASTAVVTAGDAVAGWGMEGLLRNTVVVTMLNAGLKPNIIPGVAEATLNARLMPGTDLDAFLVRLRHVIGDNRVRLDVLEGDARVVEVKRRSKVEPSRLDTDLFHAIEAGAQRTWPNIAILPTLLVASTDATPWRARGVPVYGIAPFATDPDDAARIHGDDERVSLSAINEGSEFIYQTILAAAGGRGKR